MSTEEALLEAIKAVVKEAVRDEVREQLEALRALGDPAPIAGADALTSELDEAFGVAPASRRRKVGR
jgi:hypothetical protein